MRKVAYFRVRNKSKSLIKKIIKHRKRLPQKIAQKSMAKIYPAYHRLSSTGQKVKHEVKLVVSPSYKHLQERVKDARRLTLNGGWQNAVDAWVSVISEFGEKAPLEAYLKLSQSYVQIQDYENARSVLRSAVDFAERRWGGELKQSTLVDWLSISKEKADVSLCERIDNIANYRVQIDEYQKLKKSRAKNALKIAVVSAVSGGYDAFRPPALLDSRLDYIVYTDIRIDDYGIYDVRALPYLDGDNTRSARFVKTNAQHLLPDYDYVVWIDANVMITGDIYSLIKKFIESGKDVGAMRHPLRNSPYEEMKACIHASKDDYEAITAQRDYYQGQNYSTHKLIESNLLFYNLNNSQTAKFLTTWWNQIDRFSRRDQFSINYSLDVNNVSWVEIMDYPNTTRNSEIFALVGHGKGSLAFKRFVNLIKSNLIHPYNPNDSYYKSKSERLELVKNKSVSAVVCAHNALADVKLCLDSVKEHRSGNFGLILVDDGSDQDTRKLLKDFSENNRSWVKLIRHANPKGYTKAANAGMKASNAELTILLNSDTIVAKDWYQKMADAVFNTHGAGIVGPMSSAASTQSLPHYKGNRSQTAVNQLPSDMSIEDMNLFCEKTSVNYIPRVPLVHGFCFGITRDVLDKIGYFDEVNFPRGYGEENDYCFRAANAGFGLVIATNTYIYHSKSKTFKDDKQRSELMQSGAIALVRKHGDRRIYRAVLTMEQQPILSRLRKLSQVLYTKDYIYNVNHSFPVVSPKMADILEDLQYDELRSTLVGLNKRLVNWDKLKLQKRSKLVSVVVLVYGHLEMTKRCIESIMSSKTSIGYELLVIDNGSDLSTIQGLHDYIATKDGVKLIYNEQNFNYALGNNIGFAKSSGDTIVFLNNDTIVTDGWLDTLIAPLNEDESVRATQPLLLYPDNTVQTLGTVFSDKSPLGYALYSHQSSRDDRIVKSRRLQSITAACLAIRASDFIKLEGFDPNYINGQEDTDLCLRLKDTYGIDKPCFVTVDSIVYHDESKTPGRGKYIYANREIFIQRWADKINPDDTAIYGSDNVVIDGYSSDDMGAVALYRPVIK